MGQNSESLLYILSRGRKFRRHAMTTFRAKPSFEYGANFCITQVRLLQRNKFNALERECQEENQSDDKREER